MTPAEPGRSVLGDRGWQWLRDGEWSLLPAPARPGRLWLMWLGLVMVVAVLAGVVVEIGTRL